MKDYCLPNNVGDIPDYDTGVIIVIIIYFIARDHSLCMTKLNGYIALLDMQIKADTGEHLFRLNTDSRGLIRDFRLIINHMIALNLISPRSNHQYNLLKDVLNIKYFPHMLLRIKMWLDKVINDYIYMTAEQLVEYIANLRNSANKKSKATKRSNNSKFDTAIHNTFETMRQRLIDFDSSLDDFDSTIS